MPPESENERTIEVTFAFRRRLLQCLLPEDRFIEETDKNAHGLILYAPNGTKLIFKVKRNKRIRLSKKRSKQ